MRGEINSESIKLFNFLLLAHVIYPNEKSDEANGNDQFIEPGTHEIHDRKNSLKTSCNKVPECIHE
jgi:hypothetical protein